MTVMVPRFPWGEESLLREDTDESLWFFGPVGHNKYRVAGVSWDFFIIDGGKNSLFVNQVRMHHSGRRELEEVKVKEEVERVKVEE